MNNQQAIPAPEQRFTADEIREKWPKARNAISIWSRYLIERTKEQPYVPVAQLRLAIQMANSYLSLCEAVWLGKRFEPTEDQPQQDFHEALVESFRIQHSQDEERIANLSRSVLNQCGDNLCHLGSATTVPPPPEEMLESCKRYIAQLSGDRGVLTGCMTIAQLEAEVERLRVALLALADESGQHCCSTDDSGVLVTQHPCTCWRARAREAAARG